MEEDRRARAGASGGQMRGEACPDREPGVDEGSRELVHGGPGALRENRNTDGAEAIRRRAVRFQRRVAGE